MKSPWFIATLFLVLIIAGCAPQSHLMQGKKYIDDYKYDRAIKELEKAANDKGDLYYYIDVYSHLGDAYARNGQPDNAVSIYRNALQIIHLRLREIAARRIDIRRELNSKPGEYNQAKRDKDMRLVDEELRLKEKEKEIKGWVNGLTDRQ